MTTPNFRTGLAAAMADQGREPCTRPSPSMLCAREAGHEPPCYMTAAAPLIDGIRELAEMQADWDVTSRVLTEVFAEVDRAHSIHGRSVEDGTDSDRARILLCEAVEASQAVDAVTHAARYRRLLMDGAPGDLDGARATLEERRRDLRSEVVQVAAVAFRWLLAEGGAQ